MAQCIWLRCKLEAWSSEDGVDKSYFCLEHAWKNARGDLRMLPKQLEIYNNEGFQEYLTAAWKFPEEYRKQRADRANNTKPWGLDGNLCHDCGKQIVAGTHMHPVTGKLVRRRYCGACRTKRGLDDQETTTYVRCANKGRYLDRECQVQLPADMAVRSDRITEVYCAPCFRKLDHMGAQWRSQFGYNW